MNPSLDVPAPTTPPVGQPLRSELRSRSLEEMHYVFSELVKGRPGWYENKDEQEWYFYPDRVGEPVTDQTTTFSEADYVLPQETPQIDAYLAPMYREVQGILQSQPNWHYDDEEKAWVFESPLASGFKAKFVSWLRNLW